MKPVRVATGALAPCNPMYSRQRAPQTAAY
jgi:hypothetical protein